MLFCYLFARERKDLQGQLGEMENWDQEGCQGLQDLLGLQGRMETRCSEQLTFATFVLADFWT